MGRPAPLEVFRRPSRAALLPIAVLPLAAVASLPALAAAPAAPAPAPEPTAKAAAASGRGSLGEEAPFVIWQPEGPPPPVRPTPLGPDLPGAGPGAPVSGAAPASSRLRPSGGGGGPIPVLPVPAGLPPGPPATAAPPPGMLPPGMLPPGMVRAPQGLRPGLVGGLPPGMPPGMVPGMPPGMRPGLPPGMRPALPPGMPPGVAPGMRPALPPLPPLPPTRLGSARPGLGPSSAQRATTPAPWTWLAAITALGGGAGMFLLERRRRARLDAQQPLTGPSPSTPPPSPPEP